MVHGILKQEEMARKRLIGKAALLREQPGLNVGLIASHGREQLHLRQQQPGLAARKGHRILVWQVYRPGGLEIDAAAVVQPDIARSKLLYLKLLRRIGARIVYARGRAALDEACQHVPFVAGDLRRGKPRDGNKLRPAHDPQRGVDQVYAQVAERPAAVGVLFVEHAPFGYAAAPDQRKLGIVHLAQRTVLHALAGKLVFLIITQDLTGKEHAVLFLRIIEHLPCVRIGQRDGLFAGDVRAVGQSEHGHFLMQRIRRADRNKIGPLLLQHLLRIGIPGRDIETFGRLLGGNRINVAHSGKLDPAAQIAVGRNMRGVCNHAATDDGNLQPALVQDEILPASKLFRNTDVSHRCSSALK